MCHINLRTKKKDNQRWGTMDHLEQGLFSQSMVVLPPALLSFGASPGSLCHGDPASLLVPKLGHINPILLFGRPHKLANWDLSFVKHFEVVFK